MNYKDVNDYEILYLIGEKDEKAEEILFAKYRNLILKIAMKYLPFVSSRGAELDDLIQEGYLGLYSAIRNYQMDNSTIFYTFALVCIERQMRTYCKKLGSTKQEILNRSYSLDVPLENAKDPLCNVIAKEEESPFDKIVLSDYIEKLVSFKNSLPFLNASIFELRLNGFSYQEISTLLDIPRVKVDSILYKIRMILKKELMEY